MPTQTVTRMVRSGCQQRTGSRTVTRRSCGGPRDRPRPPWGGSAPCDLGVQVQTITEDSYAVSPVYTDEDLTNVGQMGALQREILETLAISPRRGYRPV
jgi:hypothetical protein